MVVKAQKSNLGRYILFGLIFGIMFGQLIYMEVQDKDIIKAIADKLDLISMIFLRLLKMIIAPLVFSTLIVGIAKMGDGKELGRLFLKSMIIFSIGGFAALTLGMALVEYFQPGKALSGALAGTINVDGDAIKNVCTNCQITLKSFVESLVPNSFAKGFVENYILQVVVIALFVGVAGASIGEPAAPFFNFFEIFSHILFKIINYIMYLAPFAVFAAIAKLVMGGGIGILKLYLVYALQFYLGLTIIWVVLGAIGLIVIGRKLFGIIKSLMPLYAASFAASSSEVALPGILSGLQKHGVSKKVSSFVLPLGYSFNLEASMLNCTFATMFIIQVYGYEISFATQITMLLMLMLTSKGIAGVPRASLVVVAATLAAFGYPETGVLLLLPIDSLMDMGRSATNAFANTMSTLFVDRWERKHNLK